MSSKFIRRTLRNVVFRDHPYFAHLALTHKCNLRCRFCHIQDEKFQELDTGGMKRVIDVLDEMGVGRPPRTPRGPIPPPGLARCCPGDR